MKLALFVQITFQVCQTSFVLHHHDTAIRFTTGINEWISSGTENLPGLVLTSAFKTDLFCRKFCVNGLGNQFNIIIAILVHKGITLLPSNLFLTRKTANLFCCLINLKHSQLIVNSDYCVMYTSEDCFEICLISVFFCHYRFILQCHTGNTSQCF